MSNIANQHDVLALKRPWSVYKASILLKDFKKTHRRCAKGRSDLEMIKAMALFAVQCYK